MKLDLQSLFRLNVHKLYSLAETPEPSPLHPPKLGLRGRYWSAKIDDISLRPPGYHSMCIIIVDLYNCLYNCIHSIHQRETTFLFFQHLLFIISFSPIIFLSFSGLPTKQIYVDLLYVCKFHFMSLNLTRKAKKIYVLYKKEVKLKHEFKNIFKNKCINIIYFVFFYVSAQ